MKKSAVNSRADIADSSKKNLFNEDKTRVLFFEQGQKKHPDTNWPSPKLPRPTRAPYLFFPPTNTLCK